VRVISLNRERVLEELREAAERLIAQNPDVEAVVLFGSLADGTATGTSDADVLLVLKRSSERFLDRIPEFLEAFRGLSVPVDVFPYTVEELERQLQEGVGTGRTALTHGRLLAGQLPTALLERSPREKLLIYDGECAYCRAFVAVLQRLDRQRRFRALAFDAQQARALLQAQFGERYGFAMYLFELNAGEVSWGREAARRVVRGLGLPHPIARLAFWLYPAVVRLVSWLTRRRRRVCGPECLGSSPPQGKRKQVAPLREEARALLRAS